MEEGMSSPPETSSLASWPDLEEAVTRLFVDKTCLAPMVRAGTLPFRLLCLEYGADTVWGEEIISHKLATCSVRDNVALGTRDYVTKDGRSVVFRTCSQERGKVIMQLGVGDPVLGLKAAEVCVKDVAGIDINMGCPKKFSIQGGMGAALLNDIERSTQIVKTLRTHMPVPITCKIRLLDSVDKTVDLARSLEAAGAHAITVHARTISDAPTDSAKWEEITPVVQSVRIPVLANGDLYTHKDWDQVKAMTGCSGIMLARPALYNASIFKRGEPLPLDKVICDYLAKSCQWGNVPANTKYVIMEMMSRGRHPDHRRASLPVLLPPDKSLKGFSKRRTMQEMCEYWDMEPPTCHDRSIWTSSSPSKGIVQETSSDGRVYSDAYFLDRDGEDDPPPPPPPQSSTHQQVVRAEKRRKKDDMINGENEGQEPKEDR